MKVLDTDDQGYSQAIVILCPFMHCLQKIITKVRNKETIIDFIQPILITDRSLSSFLKILGSNIKRKVSKFSTFQALNVYQPLVSTRTECK